MKLTSKVTIYLAGPMSGYEDCNYPEFNRLAALLRSNGYRVLNPADLGFIDGFICSDDYWPINKAMLKGADYIYMLPGWESALGAIREYEYAVSHQIYPVTLHDLGIEIS